MNGILQYLMMLSQMMGQQGGAMGNPTAGSANRLMGLLQPFQQSQGGQQMPGIGGFYQNPLSQLMRNSMGAAGANGFNLGGPGGEGGGFLSNPIGGGTGLGGPGDGTGGPGGLPAQFGKLLGMGNPLFNPQPLQPRMNRPALGM